MVHNKGNRKYFPLWDTLKNYGTVSIKFSNKLTPEQHKKQYLTIRKAVSKEKYMDAEFRMRYPNSLITSGLDTDTDSATFYLTLDTAQITI